MARKRTNLSRMSTKNIAASRRGWYEGDRCKTDGCPFLACYDDGLCYGCHNGRED